MIRKIIAIALLQIIFLSPGCKTLPRPELGKTYQDKGKIIRRIGDGQCSFVINTEHHGAHETDIYNGDECHEYKPGMTVEVEIYNQWQVRILARAGP